jgi:hypothetical protein
MPKSDEIVSAEGRDDQNTDSVFDFLYHDARRVGSFLAQFDHFGHLQQVSAKENAAKGGKRGYSLKLGGNLPALPGSIEGTEGSLTFSRDSSVGSEGLERVYDPLWTNALALLDYLDERGLIHRDVTTGRLGQFVIATGQLSILNMVLLPKIWESKAVRDMSVRQYSENARQQWAANPENGALKGSERSKMQNAVVAAAIEMAKAGMDVLPSFPHSAQCTISGANASVWSTLSAEGLVGTVADLSLKHGTEIPGEWHLLGVLDAQPNPVAEQTVVASTGTLQHFGNVIKNFSNLGRTLLGRPPEAYGVTALLLFRKVAAQSEI